VVLAGVLASERLTGRKLGQHTYLFFGAGEAGLGIGELIAATIAEQGTCHGPCPVPGAYLSLSCLLDELKSSLCRSLTKM